MTIDLPRFPTEEVAEATTVQPEGDPAQPGACREHLEPVGVAGRRPEPLTGPTDGASAPEGRLPGPGLRSDSSEGCQGGLIQDLAREQHHRASHGGPVLHPETLAALRSLAEAATPGPWRPSPGNRYGAVSAPLLRCPHLEAGTCLIPPPNRPWSRCTPDDNCDKAYGGRLITESCSNANGAFIATADPQMVIALVDEIERLRAL